MSVRGFKLCVQGGGENFCAEPMMTWPSLNVVTHDSLKTAANVSIQSQQREIMPADLPLSAPHFL